MGNVRLGPQGWQSTYSREEGIVFDKMPEEEWQYMATATGRTGVAVIAKEPLILQINHEGSLDERGYWHATARLLIDLEGCPLSLAASRQQFRMVHDLHHSVIHIYGEDVTVHITAYMEQDVIGVSIEDNRPVPQKITVSLQVPYHADRLVEDNALIYVHENGEDTCWHTINETAGMPDDDAFEDPLSGRCFGLAVTADGLAPSGNGWRLAPRTEHSLMIAAHSGKETFPTVLTSRLAGLPTKAEMDAGQAAWFDRFWSRVWFDCPDESMRPFTVSYDIYRYFTGICSGVNREFPLRFQIVLLCNQMGKMHWATMQIHSIQTIQAYFGMLRNGDWDALAPFERDYKSKMDFYHTYTAHWGGKEGLFIPYETNMWGTCHYHSVTAQNKPHAGEYHMYHLSDHKWSMYSYEHGLALLLFLWDAALARGEEEAFTIWGFDALYRCLIFFLERYPVKDGHIVFDPATSGETWFDCRNPSSWIALLRVCLPRIAAAASTADPRLADIARKLEALLPELPLGQWQLSDNRLGTRLSADENKSVLLPAEQFDRHPPINRENPELYALWPYGLLGWGAPDYDLALRTYQNRQWKRLDVGWSLDCIWAARLGLTEEARSYADWQFPTIVRFPGGLCYEESPARNDQPTLPVLPSMQGMGNGVCPLFEMICQERGDHLLLLAAWPEEVPFRMALYTALSGRLELEYIPGKQLVCKTERVTDLRTKPTLVAELVIQAL